MGGGARSSGGAGQAQCGGSPHMLPNSGASPGRNFRSKVMGATFGCYFAFMWLVSSKEQGRPRLMSKQRPARLPESSRGGCQRG